MSKNIVLITIDSLRADHCGFLGSDAGLTPALDGLAGESIVYEYALAPGPRTPSSMPAIFTGEFFQRDNRGVYTNWDEKRTRWKQRQDRVRRHLRRFQTVAERLQGRGYHTAGITANPWTTRATGFDTGFDTFVEVGGHTSSSSRTPLHRKLIERYFGIELKNWLLTWPDYFDEIVEVHDSLPEPYFLWVFLLDPHQPYITPRRVRQETNGATMYYANLRYNLAHSYTETLPPHLDTLLKRAYRDSVRSVDGFVDEMRRLIADEDPHIVVHADHGEAFQEHGTYGHRPQLYAENLHVPFIVHSESQPRRIDRPISLRALPEVISALAGSDGIDPNFATSEHVLSKTEECERIAVRSREWTFHSSPHEWDYIHGLEPTELYALRNDPREQVNVVDEYPDVASSLSQLLELNDAFEEELDHVSDAVAELYASESI